jgi:hypothetical protein
MMGDHVDMQCCTSSAHAYCSTRCNKRVQRNKTPRKPKKVPGPSASPAFSNLACVGGGGLAYAHKRQVVVLFPAPAAVAGGAGAAGGGAASEARVVRCGALHDVAFFFLKKHNSLRAKC